MKKYFSIGETAKINNISIQALRHYDKIGILKPAYVDLNTNYRYYTINQFIYIDLIKYSKSIGAPLKNLKNVLDDKDIYKMLSFIRKQHEELEKEIFRLNNMSKSIKNIENKIEYALNISNQNEIYFRDLDERFVVNTLKNIKDTKSDIEIKSRKFDKILEENEIMYEGEFGYFFDLEAFLKKGTMIYSSILSTVSSDKLKYKFNYCIENLKIDIKKIPKGNFICISYLDKDREDAIDKLRKYIIEKKIDIKEVALESQLFNTIDQLENGDMLYEIQILI
ncbi:helix-turn-helix domain-containing protein [Clostridium oceanicum]|uniref:MerR family transcriptional regulator n=1 Tax=Clostridium oceanicum TaxID=1543 RepID=A0ABN1JEI4_9CLOT